MRAQRRVPIHGGYPAQLVVTVTRSGAGRKGGPTTLAKGCCCAGVTTRFVHHDAWTVRSARDGLPEFIPPRWIDPTRAPLRNHRHTRPPEPPAAGAAGLLVEPSTGRVRRGLARWIA
jgi:hypothetical protein